MNRTIDDELESALRDLFERQAEAVPSHARAWDDPPMVTVTDLRPEPRSRPAVLAVVSLAAAVMLVIGLVAIAPGRHGVAVGGQPGAGVPVEFATPQVRLVAGAMLIDANGHRFTAGGSVVDVNSDPGTPNKYTTLELTWNERGVEMRLNIYFASDGHDWWASEIRTYNGNANGDWIYYAGTYFRSALGSAFVGDVDLRATDGNGRLQLTNLRLQAFLPPAACTHATARYALTLSYDSVDMPDLADGFGLGTTRLLDTTTCTEVAENAYEFDWQIANPAVALFDDAEHPDAAKHSALMGVGAHAPIDLAAKGKGTTTLHVSARRKSDGAIVASAEIPVSVG